MTMSNRSGSSTMLTRSVNRRPVAVETPKTAVALGIGPPVAEIVVADGHHGARVHVSNAQDIDVDVQLLEP